jgi:hypothetical protein
LFSLYKIKGTVPHKSPLMGKSSEKLLNLRMMPCLSAVILPSRCR